MPGGIEIKTRDEIGFMREASLIVYEVLEELSRAVAPGVTLEELDDLAERETVRRGAVCAFKGLYGFPKNICISVNEQVVHGIPSRREPSRWARSRPMRPGCWRRRARRWRRGSRR